jgi:hypothetical protein
MVSGNTAGLCARVSTPDQGTIPFADKHPANTLSTAGWTIVLKGKAVAAAGLPLVLRAARVAAIFLHVWPPNSTRWER